MKIAEIRQLALALPETAEAPHFDFASFRVRGRIFLAAPPHGDHLHCFPDEAIREQALALHPLFVEELHWGRKVAGVRVLLAKAEPDVVRWLIDKSWQCKAPKSLLGRPG